MPHILVVTGSVRPDSVNAKMTPLVVAELKKQGAEVTVANLKELNMPFYDAPIPPTTPGFEAPHESVKQWTQMVVDADGVLLVTPEYNHTVSPVQLNAIDWIGKEWEDKPVAFVGYGWVSGARQAHATAREVLASSLKAKVSDTQTNLFFTRELNPDGSIADQAKVDASIAETVRDLLVL